MVRNRLFGAINSDDIDYKGLIGLFEDSNDEFTAKLSRCIYILKVGLRIYILRKSNQFFFHTVFLENSL